MNRLQLLTIHRIFHFCLFLLSIHVVQSVRYCNLCSDPSIETHYGGFFINPRDLQDGIRHNITRCDRTRVSLQECEDSCFSLNVTSLHIKSKKLLPFGVSYGCSSMIIENMNAVGCFRKDIVLKTVPPYVVQADYCLCDSTECNEVHISPKYQHQQSSDSAHYRNGQSFYGYSAGALPMLSSYIAIICIFTIQMIFYII